MARGGYRPNAGRTKGSRNETTIQREERIRLDVAAVKAVSALSTMTHKPGKQVMQEFMTVFAGMAAAYQPAPPGQPKKQHEDEAKFARYARLAIDCAMEVAQYEEPKLRAAFIQTPPEPNPMGQPRPGDDARVVNMHDTKDQARGTAAYMRLIAATG